MPFRRPSAPALAAALLAAFASLAFAQTYTAWRSANFTSAELSNPAISGPGADPDGDGISNLHEFVFVGAPKIADTGISPVLELIDDTLALTYRERHGFASSGVRVNLEISETLHHWITPNAMIEVTREAFTEEGFDLVTLIDPFPPVSGANPRRFLRLRADPAPSAALKSPTAVGIKPLSPTLYEISWNDWNRDETGHRIERLASANSIWEPLGTVAADVNVWQHVGADYRNGFTYRVAALRGETVANSAAASLPDTDGDGIPDAFELGSSYTGGGGTYPTSPYDFSSGGSGVSDLWAIENGFNPLTHDFSTDTDGDGLSDYEEAMRGTDPRTDDTDGDGVPDSEDGWPRHAWITVAPLPEVRYAVLALRSLGLPANVRVTHIDDAADLLAWREGDWQNDERGAAVYFSPIGGQLLEPLALRLPSRSRPNAAFDQSPVIRWGYTLSPSGVVGGFREVDWVFNEVPWAWGHLQAVEWTPAQDLDEMMPIPYSPWVSPVVEGQAYVSYLRAITRDRHRLLVQTLGNGQIFLYDDQVVSFRSGDVWVEDFFNPSLLNDSGILAGNYYAGFAPDGDSPDYATGAVWEGGSLTFLEARPITLTYGIPEQGVPVVVLGVVGSDLDWRWELKWAHRRGAGDWAEEALRAFDSVTMTERVFAEDGWWLPNVNMNDRLEILVGDQIVRNGVIRPLSGLVPSDWTIIYDWRESVNAINAHGVIATTGSRSGGSTEPVLLHPVELTSEDRLLKGSLRIPEGATDFSLSFRSAEENGLDLGTFAKLEPGAIGSPTYIYASADDIFSEDEQAAAAAGTLDPRANSQSVVFTRDPDDPRRLHFATAFDQAGGIEITLAFGPEGQRVTGKVTHTLTAQAEAAGLIATFDQRIQSMDIPEVVDFDLDLDGDGVPDGGPDDLVTGSQPGTMAAPGPFVSEKAEDDPLNLVLLVNSDDDNADGIADHLHPDLDAADDDLARIVLRAPAGATSGTLTLTHGGGPALRLRFPTGPPIASGTTVNLASPSGPLAGLADGPLTLYAEGLAPADDVAITLAYTPAGESAPTASDTVRLTILDPEALAALQQRHRYFVRSGDLGGLLSRAYAANGAYRQHRLGFAPIGENPPLQNRGLLAKSLYFAIGNLKVTAAFYRGTVDGFWMGLKSDWQGLQDAGTAAGSVIAFFFVEDDEGRMARAVAIYDKIQEIKDAFAGIKLRELPGTMGKMAGTITRDLYTAAEAELGWEPIQPGIDPQVVSYMAGVTTGFVGEQVMMALIPGGAAAKIAPVLRGVVLAVKNGTHYSLDAVGSLAKATAKLGRGAQQVARSQDEVKAALHATQKVKKIDFPGGLKAPQVIDDWFRLKPQLKDDVLNIWADKLHTLPKVTDQRLTHLMNDLATVVHRFGNNPGLSDDAVKGFAHLQGRLFKAGDDTLSRWKDMEKLFGGLNTPAKRAAMQESLVAYKQAVELNPAAKFWVKNFSAISEDTYHYAPNLKRLEGNGQFHLSAYNGERGWYVTTDKMDNMAEAAGKLQLPEVENARYRIKMPTAEIDGNLKVPKGWQNLEPHLEPVTRDFPDLGPGKATQLLLENKAAPVAEVYDTVLHRILTTTEIEDLISL